MIGRSGEIGGATASGTKIGRNEKIRGDRVGNKAGEGTVLLSVCARAVNAGGEKCLEKSNGLKFFDKTFFSGLDETGRK